MSKAFNEKLLKSDGYRSRPFHSSFAAGLLKKFGWTEGQGLGKTKTGIAEPIQIKRRADAVGLGHSSSQHSAASEWEDWWKGAFDAAAAKIRKASTIQELSEGSSDEELPELRRKFSKYSPRGPPSASSSIATKNLHTEQRKPRMKKAEQQPTGCLDPSSVSDEEHTADPAAGFVDTRFITRKCKHVRKNATTASDSTNVSEKDDPKKKKKRRRAEPDIQDTSTEGSKLITSEGTGKGKKKNKCAKYYENLTETAPDEGEEIEQRHCDTHDNTSGYRRKRKKLMKPE